MMNTKRPTDFLRGLLGKSMKTASLIKPSPCGRGLLSPFQADKQKGAYNAYDQQREPEPQFCPGHAFPALVNRHDFGIEKHGDNGPERHSRHGKEDRRSAALDQMGKHFGKGQHACGKSCNQTEIDLKNLRIALPERQTYRIHQRAEVTYHHQKGGCAEAGNQLGNGHGIAESRKEQVVPRLQVLQRGGT